MASFNKRTNKETELSERPELLEKAGDRRAASATRRGPGPREALLSW